MALAIRTVKRLHDGAIKRMHSGPAARLVSKGGYQYVDDGLDETPEVKLHDATKLTAMENAPSDIIKTKNIEVAENELAPEQIRKIRGKRTIKRSEIPEARMNQILATKSVPTEAAISPGRGSTALKSLIEKTKSKRKGAAGYGT